MFEKILIANRGEIAIRIMRTAKEMGIHTVAVYSEADRHSPHVSAADEAVFIGPPEPKSSYLNIQNILDSAKETAAEAIHPGYGFLSENPEFAKAVIDAGLVFIGPPADVMQKLGDKITSSQIAQNSGLPTIPGFRPDNSEIAALKKAAAEIGYPVLIKASAGGGGKGMRVVNSAEELEATVQSAQSEAQSAFGDGRVFIEKYFENARHVEIQVLADNHGNAYYLFERECSIQRRHQKIIEETPSPVLDENLREQMGKAAVALAKQAGYVNAGTVEFLLDENNQFYFLEVNTRLQVEHPITEMVTGMDLVRHQINIAAGDALPFSQSDLTQRGHAIECRIYAEDPENGFMPSPGKILLAKTPVGPGVRYDSGIETGTEVSVHYDPILAKLIVHAETRESAIDRMILALKDCVVLGVKTQVEYLIDILSSEPFRKGETYTHFLNTHFSEWKTSESENDLFIAGFALAKEFGNTLTAGSTTAQSNSQIPTPWERLGKWSL